MISDKKKFIFIHPPKVGGNTIHSLLKDYYSPNVKTFDNRAGNGQGKMVYRDREGDMDKHATLSDLYKMFPHATDYYKISVMRNPWDRTVSWFSWWHGATAAEDSCRDFRNFVQELAFPYCGGEVPNFLRSKPFAPTDAEHLPSCHNLALQPLATWWLHEGCLDVNFLIKFENFENGLREVCKKFDIALGKIPKLNTSHNKNYVEFYKNKGKFDEETIEKVRMLFKKDLKIINYNFI
jgi:hypothetical protein